MFRVHCPHHGQDVLLGHRRVLGIEGHGDELTVHWVCHCGHRGSHRPQRPEPVTAAFPA